MMWRADVAMNWDTGFMISVAPREGDTVSDTSVIVAGQRHATRLVAAHKALDSQVWPAGESGLACDGASETET